jgi:type VI protein secretion system component VasF
MKHSSSIKFPIKFLISTLAVCFVFMLVLGYLLFQYHLSSKLENQVNSQTVVEQIDLVNYNKAMKYIK